MAATPTTPNLTDYVSFLSGVVGIPIEFLPTLLGTATDGTTAYLVDSTQNWNPDQWDGYTVTDLTQGLSTDVATSSTDTLSFVDSLSAPVIAGDEYLITPQVVPMSLSIALEIVNPALACASAMMYGLAVYNLATDRLINYAVDQPGQTWFIDKRKEFRLADARVGVVASASNGETSMSYLNPEQMKLFTLQDLETLKTEWGRRYMGIAQKYGLSIWGIS